MFFFLILSFISCRLFASENVVNVYAWSEVIPNSIIQQFEKETGLKVNFSTFTSNEAMYTKLRSVPAPLYDVIEPSSYYVDRMRKQNMLEPLKKSELSQFHNLNPNFLNKSYDPSNLYSVPYNWGVTGIFYDKNTIANPPQRWKDLWNPKWVNQLMLLNDSREVFSIAFLILGYSINDNDPSHIKEAANKLRDLLPNVRLFKSDGVISLLADEDVNVGMAWNGDVVKAKLTNPNLNFIYPKEGFVIWVDNFAIPKSAPHKTNALRFINFMMRPDIAAAASLKHGFPTANLTAQKKLPKKLRNDPVAYPKDSILKRGQFQADINDQALALFEYYWEKLLMGE